MAENFGVVTFDDHGPIKSWSRMAAVADHNNRKYQEAHCNPEGPKPIHLCGTTDLIGDVKAQLLKHGIDPAKLRKNAAIAFEAIMTASRSFFDAGTGEEALSRTGAWIKAACDFARRFWGENRVVSMVLHLDEMTPHIHVVLLPLAEKVYKRWPHRGKTWALVGRTISGPGMYQRVHDGYAAAMAPFGLARGLSGSRAKYRPYAAELADLAAEKARAAAAADAALKAVEEADQQAKRAAAVREEEQARTRQVMADLEEREAKIANADAAVRLAAMRLEAQRRRARIELKAAEKERQAAARERAKASDAIASVERSIDDLAKVLALAETFRAGLLTVPYSEMPFAAREALKGIVGMESAAARIQVPAVVHDALSLISQHQLASLAGASR